LPKTDVAVVGGGPSGLLAAINAVPHGDVLVLEEHPVFGQPAHCGGLVSLDAFDKLAIRSRGDIVLNEIRGFVLHSPSGIVQEIDAGRPCAQVIDRPLLEQHLAEIAEDRGCRLKHARVRSLRQREGAVLVDAYSGECVRASVAIDAEGIGRRLASGVGFDARMGELLPSAQVTVRCREIDRSFAHVFLGGRYGGFMAYSIPVDGHIARIGCATRGSDPARVCEIVGREMYGMTEVVDASRWAIWTGGGLRETKIGRVLLVGDAAGHTKPTTGGGIVLGGMLAKVTGEAAGRYAATLDEGELRATREGGRSIRRSINRMLLIRRLMSIASDRTIDEGIGFLGRRKGELGGILRSADFDFHDRLPLSLAADVALTKIPLMLLSDILSRGMLN